LFELRSKTQKAEKRADRPYGSAQEIMRGKKRGSTGKKVADLRQQKSRKAAAPSKDANSTAKPKQKRTIRQVVIEAIAANAAVTNDEMIAAVKKEFPESAFKDTHAAWYRSQARKGSLTGAPVSIPAMGRKQSRASD